MMILIACAHLILLVSFFVWSDCLDLPGYTVQHHTSHLLNDIKCISQPDVSIAMAASECHAHPQCVSFSLDLNLHQYCLKTASYPTVTINNICFYTMTSPSLTASYDSRHLLTSDPPPPAEGKQARKERNTMLASGLCKGTTVLLLWLSPRAGLTYRAQLLGWALFSSWRESS